MSFIYKITNNINNKIYIGKTNYNIEKRFREHILDSRRRKKEKRPLYNAMNKYGVENFSIEIVEECSPSMANEREIYWIEYYDSFKNGYNATIGGDGKTYLNYDFIYKIYLKTLSIKETAKICNCCTDSVKIVLNLYNYPKEQIKINSRVRESMRKPVVMLDKKTGNLLKIYPFLKEVSKDFPGARLSHIPLVCHGKQKTALGYSWKFLEDYDKNLYEEYLFSDSRT